MKLAFNRRKKMVAILLLLSIGPAAIFFSLFLDLAWPIATANLILTSAVILILLRRFTNRGSIDRSESLIKVFSNQDEAMPTLLAQVDGSIRADLLEYAGATTLPLIRAIRRKKIPMRLLIKHPDSVDGMQKQRTLTTLDTLLNSVFAGYVGDFEIRCYRLPYTLRGRYFRNRSIEIGWLTPDIAGQTVHGSANLSLFLPLEPSRSEPAVRLFTRTFDDYWSHEQTEDAKIVLSTLSAEVPKPKKRANRQV